MSLRLKGEIAVHPQGKHIVTRPKIVSGSLANRLYSGLKERIDSPIEDGGFAGNPSFGIRDTCSGYNGSTPFLAALADELLRKEGLRVVDLADLSDEGLLKRLYEEGMVLDTGQFVIRGTSKGDPRNHFLFRCLADKVGYIKDPILFSNVKVVPSNEGPYRLALKVTEDTKLIRDERFGSKYNGWFFTATDELGIPKDLVERYPNKDNVRTWYPGHAKISSVSVSGKGISCDNEALEASRSNYRLAIAPNN